MRSPFIRALIYHTCIHVGIQCTCNIRVWISQLDKLTFFVLKCLTWSAVMCGIWKRQLLPRLHIPCTTIWLTFITFSNVSNDGIVPGRTCRWENWWIHTPPLSPSPSFSLSLSLSLSLSHSHLVYSSLSTRLVQANSESLVSVVDSVSVEHTGL